jgi:hypothetical protein
VDVAVKATGLSDPEVASRTFAPATGPSVHEPTVATPDESVVTVAPDTDPPPLTTVKVTVAPPIGNPFWSFTITEGDGVTTAPAAPVRDVAEFAATVVATVAFVDSPPQLMQASRRNAGASRAGPRKSFFTWSAGVSRARTKMRANRC